LIIEITDCDLGLEYFKFRKQPLAAGDGFIACTESVSFKIVVFSFLVFLDYYNILIFKIIFKK
jgi:hypothetical protein